MALNIQTENNDQFKWNVSRLIHTGFAVEYTNFILKGLRKDQNWQHAAQALYNTKLISSLKYAQRVTCEVERRFNNKFTPNSPRLLPDLSTLIQLAETSLSLKKKAEIFLVYIYYSDGFFGQMLNSIQDFYQKAGSSEPILRETLKTTLILLLQENTNIYFSEKILANWIGRFISILRDAQLLFPLKKNIFRINFGGISEEVFTFFLLWSYFNNQDFSSSPLSRVFYILPNDLQDLLKRVREKHWIKYLSDQPSSALNYRFHIETPYHNLSEWLDELG